jgi:hypothetical protein
MDLCGVGTLKITRVTERIACNNGKIDSASPLCIALIHRSILRSPLCFFSQEFIGQMHPERIFDSCLSFRICVTSITFEHVASLSRCFYLSNNFSIRATNADATLAIVFAALFYGWVGYSDQDDFFRDAGLKKEGEALADFDWQD